MDRASGFGAAHATGVGDDAAMLLREDWYDLMPEGEKRRANPGRYVLRDEMLQDARVAELIERAE